MVRLNNFPVVVVFLALTSSLLTAQTSVGIRGGLNFAWYNESGIEFFGMGDYYSKNSNVMTGSAFAGILEIGLSKHFALQPELVVAQKGWGKDGTDEKFVANCFDFPLLGKLKLSGQRLNFYAVIGPTFGFAATALNGKKEDEKDWGDYKRFQFSLSTGIGLGLNLKKGIMFMDVRRLHGLSSLVEVSSLPPYTHQSQRAISLTIGYLHHPVE